jgi:hypothetical protein
VFGDDYIDETPNEDVKSGIHEIKRLTNKDDFQFTDSALYRERKLNGF